MKDTWPLPLTLYAVSGVNSKKRRKAAAPVPYSGLTKKKSGCLCEPHFLFFCLFHSLVFLTFFFIIVIVIFNILVIVIFNVLCLLHSTTLPADLMFPLNYYFIVIKIRVKF